MWHFRVAAQVLMEKTICLCGVRRYLVQTRRPGKVANFSSQFVTLRTLVLNSSSGCCHKMVKIIWSLFVHLADHVARYQVESFHCGWHLEIIIQRSLPGCGSLLMSSTQMVIPFSCLLKPSLSRVTSLCSCSPFVFKSANLCNLFPRDTNFCNLRQTAQWWSM